MLPKIILLLSIRPEYAKKVFDGTKTVELRRIKPRVSTGDLIYVYVSSPVKALIGVIEVSKVISGTPDDLWAQVQDSSGIAKEQYDMYFAGASHSFGILLNSDKITLLPQPLHLSSLRREWTSFSPPQSYRYLTSDDVARIHAMSGQTAPAQMHDTKYS